MKIILNKKICSVVNFLFITALSFAQSDFDLSQRHFNEALYNPASTGSNYITTMYAHTRAQWINMPGAPTTEVLYVNHYFYGWNAAAGLSISGDQIGFTNTYSARFAFAYYIPVPRTEKYALSFGLSAAYINRNQNASGALVDDLTDGELYYGDISENRSDYDFGVELHGALQAGVAVRHIGSKDNSGYFKPLSINIWSYASYKIELSDYVFLEPAVSHFYRERFNRFEAGAFMYLMQDTPKYVSDSFSKYDKYWFGGMWRLHGQFSVIAGLSISPYLKLGYSFDHAPGELSKISEYGTHEIFIAWNIHSIRNKLKNSCCRGSKDNDKFVNDVSTRFEF